MKLRLTILLCCFVLCLTSANGQNSLDADIHNLQKQIQMWEVIVRENPKAPDNALNVSRLTNKQRELLSAVTTRIEQLRNAGDTNSQRHRELTILRDGLLTVLAPPQIYQPNNAVRARAVTPVRAGNVEEGATSTRTISASTQLASAPVTLDAMRVGDSVIQGTSVANVNQVVIEIRSAGSISYGKGSTNSRYSHSPEPSPTTSVQTYRVARDPASRKATDVWRFAIKLSEPLLANHEVRTIPNGNSNAASLWIRPVAGRTGELPSLAKPAPLVAALAEDERQRYFRATNEVTLPGLAGYPSGDSVPDYYRCSLPSKQSYDVYLDWNDGISPSQAKHSGSYCVHVLNVNPILYTYRITGTDLPQTSENPLALLAAAVTAVKTIPQPATAPANAAPVACDALAPEISNVKQRAADLEDALAVINPKQKDKTVHISRETTKNAFLGPISTKFNEFERAIHDLQQTLAAVHYQPDCEPIKDADDLILNNYRDARQGFLNLGLRVNASPEWASVLDVDSSKGKDIKVEELYSGEPTGIAAKHYTLEPGYVVITSSAGFMITQLAARSYSAVTAPNPADPTTTQTVLGVDYGAGTRLALTALLNYNLPFAVQKDFGVALSVGPVFDISAGKADTSRFGLFGGVGIRLKQLMYITPGVHIGEFADFPQGFTRAGQVVPANFPTPTPVKRWTTRFALAVTFKIKDLWTPSGAGEGSGKETK